MKSLLSIPSRVWTFLKEAKLELSKTTWPNRKEVVKYTVIVVVLSLVLAAFLGGLDMFFNFLLNKFVL